MKIRFTLPWGGEFEYQREPREPMDKDKLFTVCVTICIVAAVAGFFGVFIFG